MRKHAEPARILTAASLAAALGLGGLVGCTPAGSATSEAASTAESVASAESTAESVAGAESTSEAASTDAPAESSASGEETEVVNPWHQASTAGEAAQGAGVDGFEIMDSVDVSGVGFETPVFFYMDGVAQVTYNSEKADGTTLVIRKSNKFSGKEALAGDYNADTETWTQDHKGLDITCYGSAQDQARLIMWQVDLDSFSAAIYGGSDAAMTMSPDDVASLVEGVQ